ncbi:MAG: TerB family tellurite resistance protein [Anaerolineae bacterium]|nr:TerB family tellurite resistance protein [Gloeobacterales cyanobacterium ES-bin-313]
MENITYESIYPLIARAEQVGTTMNCLFVCPVSSEQIQASATIERFGQNAMIDSAKQTAMWSIRDAIGRSLRSAFGYGVVGRMVGDIAGSFVSPDYSSQQEQTFTDEEKCNAIVAAFIAANAFVWEQDHWVSSKALQDRMTDFEKQLTNSPIAQHYDRLISARMLIGIALADGQLSDQERGYFSSFIAPDLGAVEELAQRGTPGAVELEETSQGDVRSTMLMLAWSIALTDGQLAPAEAALLETFATSLGITADQSTVLKGSAQAYILNYSLDYFFTHSPQTADQQSQQLAQQLGMGNQEAERAIIQYKKRRQLY